MPKDSPEDLFRPVVGLFLTIAAANRRDVPAQTVLAAIKAYTPGAEEWFKQSRIRYPRAIIDKIIARIKTGKTRNPQYWALMKDLYKEVGLRVKKKIANDPNVSASQTKLFNATAAMFAAREYTRLDVLDDKILPLLGSFKSNNMKAMWRKDIESQDTGELEYVVKKLTGKRGDFIPSTEVTEEMRKSQLYKKYLALRREAAALYKNAIRTIVQDSGKDSLPVAQVRAQLEREGIKIHPLDKKLDFLNIGENAKLYTRAGREIPAFPTPGSEIIINPEYNPRTDDQWVFKFRIPNGKTFQWAYTENYIKNAAVQKFDLVKESINDISSARKKWLADLTISKSQWNRALGAIVELLYSYAARIGGEGNMADGERTYGISTLLVKHVHFGKDGVYISYKGKKGTPQKHVIKPTTEVNKALIKTIEMMVKGKKPSNRLFTDKDGTPVSSGDVNRYIRSLGLKITAHKFRHLKSSVLFEKYDKEKPLPKNVTQSKAEAHFKQLVTRIGEVLGHRTGSGKVPWTTAAKAYLDPSLARDWFRKNGLKVPLFVKDLKD